VLDFTRREAGVYDTTLAQCIAVHHCVLQCVAACCSVLKRAVSVLTSPQGGRRV